VGTHPAELALLGATGDGNRTRMASLEDRGWIMALTSKC
jgi:hypothetical protein